MPIPIEWDLTGKVAIITSDNRGWTPTLAEALAEAGANVAIVGAGHEDMAKAKNAVEKVGGTAVTIPTNLTDRYEVTKSIDTTLELLGGLDILINNASVEFGKPFEDVTESEWQAIMDFNVKSVYLFSQAAGKHMLIQEKGRIVNIGSGLSARGLSNSVAACAAQGAIHQITQALALEWSRKGILVNGIGAGWVTTEEPTEETARELLVRYLPSKRKGHPRDLAALLVYLSSDSCDFVTGQTIFMDGGALAHA